MSTVTIRATHLTKTFGSLAGRHRVTAVESLDLGVRQGEIFGLLGPNGAGKTTTVKLLLGLARPTAGQAEILGVSSQHPESRRSVGYLPEGHRFPGYLTARQTLSIFGRMSGLDSISLRIRIAELLERVRLADWIDVRVKKFSKGMTQRLGLAAALVHRPSVLLLDEPTDGVDPIGRREIRDLLRDEARRGCTILLNSHLLSEIELTCDRIAVLRRGKVVAMGRIDELTAKGSQYKLVASPIDDTTMADLRALGSGIVAENNHFVMSARDVTHLNSMLDRLRAGGSLISELTPVRSTLEDVFVDLVRAEDDAERDRGGRT